MIWIKELDWRNPRKEKECDKTTTGYGGRRRRRRRQRRRAPDLAAVDFVPGAPRSDRGARQQLPDSAPAETSKYPHQGSSADTPPLMDKGQTAVSSGG
ncbi:hypothetical protein BHE74_00046520 [Ensete ventricosum]|nr:hypothetical protein BHE74_00046520 [Ensete ventricosum]RZR98970.1 hypothetical protein BHM03_00028433 [Ensete ventricosum]